MRGVFSASCEILGQAVGGLLAQLPEDDRRRLTEIGDRSELEVEQDRDRNRDGDREPGGQPQAAIPHQLADDRRPDALPDWHARRSGVSIGSSLLGFGDFGADAVEKRPVRVERRMLRQQRRARSRRPRAADPRARRAARRRRSATGRARRRPRRRWRSARSPGGSPAAGSAADRAAVPLRRRASASR